MDTSDIKAAEHQYENIKPFSIYRGNYLSPIILTCDHASHKLPESVNKLGLPPYFRFSHAGWDIGALSFSKKLSEVLHTPLLYTNYSRLLIDCNRPLESQELIPSDIHGFTIPGNTHLTQEEKDARIEYFFSPYHTFLHQFALRTQKIFKHAWYLAIHSFTPELKGLQRPWEVSILFKTPSRQSEYLLEACSKAGWKTGSNEPYSVDSLSDYGLLVHGEQLGLPSVMIEIRQDMLSDPKKAQKIIPSLLSILGRTPGG